MGKILLNCRKVSCERRDNMSIPAHEAKSRLIEGNKRFINATSNPGDVSLERRVDTLKNGQHPYAIVLCCSDSRQVPEAIFSAGIGELFVIRVAGNVVDSHQLGSIEYAADHLDCKLVVVLGHNHCGAVEAAIKHDPDGHIKYITDDIREAIKEEKDEYIATCLNVKHSVKVIEENTDMKLLEEKGLEVIELLLEQLSIDNLFYIQMAKRILLKYLN